MILIVGLGNKGVRYANTKHNVGFLMLDFLKDSWQAPTWKQKKQLSSFVTKTAIEGKTIILAKPETYMNLSGQVVHKLKTYYKLKNNDIWIVHDEIDLPLGKFKISFGRGPAGHKGIQSIISHLKTKNIYRWRFGIAKTPGHRRTSLEIYVLKPFSKTDSKILENLFEQAKESFEQALKTTPEQAMTRFN